MPSSGPRRKRNMRLWREPSDADLVMATHDATYGLAARVVGLRVMRSWSVVQLVTGLAARVGELTRIPPAAFQHLDPLRRNLTENCRENHGMFRAAAGRFGFAQGLAEGDDRLARHLVW